MSPGQLSNPVGRRVAQIAHRAGEKSGEWGLCVFRQEESPAHACSSGQARPPRENNVLHAITTGNGRLLQKATKELEEISWSFRHPSSPVRSLKNLSLSGNTLFRKAAESGGVHPLDLDSISGKFAIQIEQAQSLAELLSLNEEVPKAYCDLVKEVSVAAFPPIIKEAITFIRFNIDQPLNLNALAQTFGVNASHLSRAFKKALGMTLTDYVTAIASHVGFNDPNYFSKEFRKWERMTPHDFRQRKKEVRDRNR